MADPVATVALEVDIYSGTYPCLRWDDEAIGENPGVNLMDGAEHVCSIALRTPGESLVGPGFSPIVWYDAHGSLGKLEHAGGDVAVAVVGGWIDEGAILTVQHEATAHPVLHVRSVFVPPPPSTDPPAPRRWLEPTDVAEYLDVPGEPDARMVACTYAVISAVERRRDDLDFSVAELVPADVRVGAARWASLMWQTRGAPTGFPGYDAETVLLESGATRAEIMRLIGWRRPLTA